nr:hypothetical protein [uncultured Acetatifactor sp.]
MLALIDSLMLKYVDTDVLTLSDKDWLALSDAFALSDISVLFCSERLELVEALVLASVLAFSDSASKAWLWLALSLSFRLRLSDLSTYSLSYSC